MEVVEADEGGVGPGAEDILHHKDVSVKVQASKLPQPGEPSNKYLVWVQSYKVTFYHHLTWSVLTDAHASRAPTWCPGPAPSTAPWRGSTGSPGWCPGRISSGLECFSSAFWSYTSCMPDPRHKWQDTHCWRGDALQLTRLNRPAGEEGCQDYPCEPRITCWG